jgi:nicotinamidase/pyrazinamidase
MKRDTLFWDVDTQYDFMRPEGRLYVPGAEGIIDTVSKVRRFALDNGYSMIASTDWHSEGNEEIADKPDFKTTFPAHCMAGSSGSERVGYLGRLTIDVVPNAPMDEEELRKLFDKKQFHVVARKEALDVFSNPNVAKILELLRPKKAVVFGVALDLCVRLTVEGLSRTRGLKVYLLRDAVKGLGVRGNDEIIRKLSQKGVEIISVADLERKF